MGSHLDVDDVTLARVLDDHLREAKKRALLRKGYAAVALNLGRNALENAALRVQGLQGDGVDTSTGSEQ